MTKIDKHDYRKDFAKSKSESRLVSSTLIGIAENCSDAEEDEEVDFDKSLKEESNSTSLDTRKISRRAGSTLSLQLC